MVNNCTRAPHTVKFPTELVNVDNTSNNDKKITYKK